MRFDGSFDLRPASAGVTSVSLSTGPPGSFGVTVISRLSEAEVFAPGIVVHA